MKMSGNTRRHFLRGAGLALALPWLESLGPRAARGDATLSRRRFVAMNFPNGVADFWAPRGVGAGEDWQLSPLLEPLAPIKSQVTVLSNVGNYSPWGGHVEPSHGNLHGAFLSCARANGTGNMGGGTSVDQVIARSVAAVAPLSSLQVGLSTTVSSFDGLPGSHSQCISWKSPTEPLPKIIDPQIAFDRIFGVKGPALPPELRAINKSILDQVVKDASALQPTLSRSDGARLDEFLTSVREVERNIVSEGSPAACMLAGRPTESYAVAAVPPDYNRNKHADIMLDLVALALQCDTTRTVSFMFDDARSDFVYDFLTQRDFTPQGSTPGTGTIGGLHGLSAAGNTNSGWATINFWFVEKLARFCQKLQAMQDGPGGTVLDQSVVWFGTEMHGGNHDGLNLPLLYVGSGGARLKVNRHVDLSNRVRQSEDLANVYLTFIRKVFDMAEPSFGKPQGQFLDAGSLIVPEILA